MNPKNDKTKKFLPYIVEFIKFTAAFAVILAIALIALHSALAMQS